MNTEGAIRDLEIGGKKEATGRNRWQGGKGKGVITGGEMRRRQEWNGGQAGGEDANKKKKKGKAQKFQKTTAEESEAGGYFASQGRETNDDMRRETWRESRRVWELWG